VTMTYIKQIIEQVNAVTERCGPVLLFGENIDTGSRISGLARGLKVNSSGRILNVGNCELTHCGVGMGIMLDGGNSVLFMKQLDFLMLGLDQIVNTLNFARAYPSRGTLGGFTIFLIACDQGYQGPQSSMNSASDIASLANVNIFCLNAAADAAAVVSGEFVNPGFRIICLSQRLFGAAPLDLPVKWQSPDRSIFQYGSGDDATIVCFNFALRSGTGVAERLAEDGIQSDLFHVNFVPGADLTAVFDSCARTGKLILIDDSKSVCKFGDRVAAELYARRLNVEMLQVARRGCANAEYQVNDDEFAVDVNAIIEFAVRPRETEIRRVVNS
jgi:pyruvate/2-oxoglutarate/acetoin dehydrogenase E1 component